MSPVREVVGELVAGSPERDDERQVEEQLERRRRPMRLIRISPREAAAMVGTVGCGGGHGRRMLARNGIRDHADRREQAP